MIIEFKNEIENLLRDNRLYREFIKNDEKTITLNYKNDQITDIMLENPDNWNEKLHYYISKNGEYEKLLNKFYMELFELLNNDKRVENKVIDNLFDNAITDKQHFAIDNGLLAIENDTRIKKFVNSKEEI